MKLFYKVSDKELLAFRKTIFTEDGIYALTKNGFSKSPFSGSWFGKNNLGDYTYELCRINEDSQMEIIVTHISKGDSWIKVYLNVFKLHPFVTDCDQLKNIDGIKFHLAPNSISKMRLRIDDYNGIPLFRTAEHKIGRYNTKLGFETQVSKLRELIKNDMSNINHFVKRWHELHKLELTDWEGNIIKKRVVC